MIEDEDDVCATDQSMTGVLNRGGLIFLSDDAKAFFCSLELKVREVCGDQQTCKCTYSDFGQICSMDDPLTSKFHALLYSVEVSDAVKEMIFCSITKLFFKVRVHHECKKYTEKLKASQAQAAFQKKSLRKTLKVASSSS